MAVQWQVSHSVRQGLWRDFPKELNKQTEDAYIHYTRDGLVPGMQRGVFYRWPNRGGQTNLRTGTRRPVRRIVLG